MSAIGSMIVEPRAPRIVAELRRSARSLSRRDDSQSPLVDAVAGCSVTVELMRVGAAVLVGVASATLRRSRSTRNWRGRSILVSGSSRSMSACERAFRATVACSRGMLSEQRARVLIASYGMHAAMLPRSALTRLGAAPTIPSPSSHAGGAQREHEQSPAPEQLFMARKLRIAAIGTRRRHGIARGDPRRRVLRRAAGAAILRAGAADRAGSAGARQPRTGKPRHRALQRRQAGRPVAGAVHRRANQRLAGHATRRKRRTASCRRTSATRASRSPATC